jgi:uncharacterized protein (TIGR03067 family)
MSINKLSTMVGVFLVLAVCLGGLAAVGLSQPEEPPKRADPATKKATEKAMLEQLQGTWKCVSMHCSGVRSEPDHTCTIKGNSWESTLDGRVYQSGTFKLVDLDATPKQIDWVITSAELEEDKDKTVRGIFMLDGDSLCWVASDAAKYPRPQSFFTQADDGCCSGLFKRADPKKDR